MFATIPLLLAATTFAQEPAKAPPVDPLIARVEGHYAKVTTLQMSFTQTVSSPLYGEQVQKGTVAFGRPGKMHWHFVEDNKHYYSTGSTMWVYLESDKQAFKYGNWDPSGSPESLLHSLDNLDELFTIAGTTSTEAGHTLSLLPKGDSAVNKVELTLDPSLTVTQISLVDVADSKTVLSFTDVKLDAELPADTFSFTAPAGVEVIEAGLPQ